MRKLAFTLVLVMLLLLFFGCVEQNPVNVVKKDSLVSGFLVEHENVKLKYTLFSAGEVVKMEKEITKNCGFEIPLRDSYKVSYADFDSGKAVNAWVGKASNKVVCSYLEDLSSGVKNACFGGVFNKDTNKCEGKPVVDYVCSVGNYDSVSGKCLINPDVNFVCSKGIYASNLGKCIFNPQVQMTCVQGEYDSQTQKCVFVPQTQIICSKGIYDSASNTCVYSPPVNNVCSMGTYDEVTETCIYDPVDLSCSEQSGNICSINQTCSENWLNSNDSNKCCSTNCTSPTSLDTNFEAYEDSPFGWNPAKPYEYAEDLGVRWTRSFGTIFWWAIQPDVNKKEYYFARDVDGGKNNNVLNLDGDLRSMPEGMHGMGLIAIDLLHDSIEHKRTQENSWAPINGEAYSNFIKTLVERYDGDNDYGCVVSVPDCYVVGDNEYPAQETITAITNRPVKYWQITNEPMLESPKSVGLTGLSELTRLSYIAMKQADPESKLISGAFNADMGYFIGVEGFDEIYLPFLQELGGNYVDVMDIHWYGDALGDYLLKDERTGESLIDHIKLSLESLFSNDVSIWITETGTHSGSIDDIKFNPQAEQQQAGDYVKRYAYGTFKHIRKLFGGLSFVEGTWFSPNNYFSKTELIYDGTGTDDLGKGVKKLGYYSYKLMTDKLEGSDWDNVQEVYNDSNIYAYKFVNKQTGKKIYVVWWDYWNELDKNNKSVTLNVGQFSTVKVTEVIPAFDNGLLLQNSGVNYPNFFNKGSVNVLNGQITITLGKSPVYIEETTEIFGNYVPHIWNEVVTSRGFCGDGICDGAAGEKTSCPSDCVIKK